MKRRGFMSFSVTGAVYSAGCLTGPLSSEDPNDQERTNNTPTSTPPSLQNESRTTVTKEEQEVTHSVPDLMIRNESGKECNIEVEVIDKSQGEVIFSRSIQQDTAGATEFSHVIDRRGTYKINVGADCSSSESYRWDVDSSDEPRTDSYGLEIVVGSTEIKFTLLAS